MKDFTDEQLKDELKKRKEEKRKSGKPELLKEFDTALLLELCEGYIDSLYNDGWVDEDMEDYIFEAAMTAAFGAGVWAWIRKQE